jgi:hypothetical protein
MKKIYSKKAQSLGGLYGGILVVASIGILLALVMYILTSMGTALQTQDVAGSVVNESGFINATGYTLANSGLQDFVLGTVSAINGSDNTTILSGNWTITDGVVTNATDVNYPDAKITYAYTYTANTASSNATDTMVTQFVEFLPWLGIILLVLAAGVVLFFIIRSFSGSNKGV